MSKRNKILLSIPFALSALYFLMAIIGLYIENCPNYNESCHSGKTRTLVTYCLLALVSAAVVAYIWRKRRSGK